MYETVECPSACLSVPPFGSRSCGFAAERPVGTRYRSIAGASTRQRWHCSSKCRQCHVDSRVVWKCNSSRFLYDVDETYVVKFSVVIHNLPSVLWRCWLGGRKGIRPAKKLSHGVLVWLSCLERDADLHMSQLIPLPLTISCFSKIQIGFSPFW